MWQVCNAIKARFIEALGALEQEARAEFANLPKEERNMSGAKKVFVSKIKVATSLEEGYDQEVAEVLVNLEKDLSPLTDDVSIIDQINST